MPRSIAAQQSFDNPDHVNIVIHNYRWRLGLAEGEAKYDEFETRLAEVPDHRRADHHAGRRRQRRAAPGPSAYAKKFSGKYQHRLITAASGTTCRRKLRRPLPKPSSTSPLKPEPMRCAGLGRR